MRAVKVEFFFDCSSPWTYLAFRGLSRLIERFDLTVDWRPILVGGVFNEVNKEVYSHRANPNPRRWDYMMKDLQDWAGYYQLSLQWPERHPISSVKAMRGALLACDKGRIIDYAEAVFAAYWTAQKDISQDEALLEFAAASNLASETFLADIEQPELKQRLRDNTNELIERGGFGSPTLYINSSDMYFGNDRLILVEHRLRKLLES